MKYLQRLLGLLAISMAMFSCQKEFSVENNPNNSTTAQWEFKEGGVQYKGPIDTVTIDTLNNFAFLIIDGHAADGSKIRLQAFGSSISPGVYKTPTSMFTYVNGSSTIYQTDQNATDSFTITITKADSLSVTGTFNGRALNGTTPKTITDGKFTAILKTSTVTPPSKDSGQVVLWSKAGCGGGTSTSPITVSVNGKSGQITSFTSTEPTTCDPAGSYNIKLPVGAYPWVAKCGTDSVTGTVTVTKGGCTKVQVDFTALSLEYFPMTKNSNWSNLYDGGTAADTLYVLSTGNTKSLTLGSSTNAYNIFVNKDGSGMDSSYYRKSGSSYYQYIPAMGYIDTASHDTIITPAYEYRFLVTNMTAGSTFTDGPYNASIYTSVGSGSIQIVLTSTVLSTTATETVGTKTYNNVIKIKTVYSYALGTGTIDYYASEQWFAPGVGSIKYMDYLTDPFTTPDYTLNLTRATVY
ncbi:MAG: hypothetical protein QM726_04575 [Chitinophagaceae bacterium]